MIRTAFTILANWALGTAFVYATGIYDAWWFSLVLDATSAFVILYQPAGKVQALIGCTYISMILTHVIYSFSNHAIGALVYWQILTGLAFVQLGLLGGWVVGHWGRRYFAFRHRPFWAVEDGKGRLAS